MAQRIIKFFQDGTFNLEEVNDVNISSIEAGDFLFHNGTTWVNGKLSLIPSYIDNTLVINSNTLTIVNKTYIVDVTNNPVTVYLPPNPEIGDTIRFIDQVSINTSSVGFATNNLTIQVSPGFLITESTDLIVSEDGSLVELIYIGNLVWKDISALGGNAGPGALLLNDLLDVTAPAVTTGLDRYIRYDVTTQQWNSLELDFVESVNSFIGDVTLTSNEIPETAQRRYYNRTRFLQELNNTTLDEAQDVTYDQAIFDGNVLTWDDSQLSWVPRSIPLNIDLSVLNDVSIDYQAQTPFFNTTSNVVIFSSEFNEQTQQTDIVDTGLVNYSRHWVLTWLDDNGRWEAINYDVLLNRALLTDLQNVAGDVIPLHGQGLMFDRNLYKWVPGGYLDIRDSDDVLEGAVNKYLTVDNLQAVAPLGLQVGHLSNVDASLIDMNANTHPTAGVLGWQPLSSEWGLVNTLIEGATTANIPESAGFVGIDPPAGDPTDPALRVYCTGGRVRRALGIAYGGQLDWIGNVEHLFGKQDGNVLAWNETESRWVASNIAQGIQHTEQLPEGPTGNRNVSKYYSDGRVTAFLNQSDVNLFGDVLYDTEDIVDGQSLVWSNDKFINGFPAALPIVDSGDLVVGQGSPFDYARVPIGAEGQYLRVDFGVPNFVRWQDKEPAYKAKIQFPDLPRQGFVTAQDFADTVLFLGTQNGTLPKEDFTNPNGTGITIYKESVGTPLPFLTDKTYYNENNNTSNAPNVTSDSASFTELFNTGNLIIDLVLPNVYRLEQIAFQAQVTGDFRFKISVSDDAINWTTLQQDESDFIFELSSTQTANEGIGINSEVISEDLSLQGRNFYLVTTPLLNEDFNVGQNLNDSFNRYIRIEPFQTISAGVCELYEISLYGYFNNQNTTHVVIGDDNDYYLQSGINNLEFILPGTINQLNELGIFEGFQAWIISDTAHTTKVSTNGPGRVISNSSEASDQPTSADPILIPPKAMAKIVYLGRQDLVYRWHLNIIGAGSGGGGSAFFLDRSNHISTQDVSTITGLHPVATSGLYSDLGNRPNLGSVATTNNYNDLTNLPTLGTASQFNTGTLANQILQFTVDNQLPPLDGSLLTNVAATFSPPTTSKGDLILHDGIGSDRLAVGTDGFVLIADSAEGLGVRWGSVAGAGTNASTLNGELASYYLDRTNHTGTQPVASIDGLATVAISGDYNSLNNLPTLGNAASRDAGILANQVLLLTVDNQLPALDGSLLTNIGTPLTTKGDLVVRGTGVTSRLAIGATGQILTVNPTAPLGVEWADASAVSNANTLDGELGSYYLDRTNHTGQQLASTISDLADVATSADYNDLINTPTETFATVATTGSYTDLLNLPSLGTAAEFNVGTGPFNIIQLDNQGNLPAGLANFTSPTTTLGDIIVRDNTTDVRLPVGADGEILVADSNEATGLNWVDISSLSVAPALPTEFKGDIIVHDGTTDVALVKGAEGYILSVDNTESTGLKWISPTASSSPLTTKGDIYTFGLDSTRLPVGPDGQVLLADSTQPTGLKWADYEPNTGNASTLNGELASYYLDRTNHTGVQNLATINDAGNAASRNAGTLANQVLLLSEDNRLPALDGSLLTNVSAAPTIITISSDTVINRAAKTIIAADTSQGIVRLTLPASPVVGDEIIFNDATGSNQHNPTGFGNHKLVIIANTGQNIQGYADLDLDTENSSLILYYQGSNRWSIQSASF